MQDEYISALEVAKKHKLFLKVVTSVTTFDNYNSFFNIFTETEEYCRRILVLTKFKELEEVNEKDPSSSITEPILIEGNIWIMEFPLTTNPNKINLEEIEVSEEFYNKIRNIELE